MTNYVWNNKCPKCNKQFTVRSKYFWDPCCDILEEV